VLILGTLINARAGELQFHITSMFEQVEGRHGRAHIDIQRSDRRCAGPDVVGDAHNLLSGYEQIIPYECIGASDF
jgi:hypothetical protein